MGNVIMPTVAGLFFALAVVRYARGCPHQYIAWSGLICLMVSGLLRGLETFASQSDWNNPDTLWITLRGLVSWSCNVFLSIGHFYFAQIGHYHFAATLEKFGEIWLDFVEVRCYDFDEFAINVA
jgi:hypothetical protein